MAQLGNNNTDQPLKDERFLRLLLAHQQEIYAYILALVANRNDADDIMQEAVTIMWRKFDVFEPGTSFRAWATAIARNRIKKFFEKYRNSRLRFSQDIIDAIEIRATESLGQMDDIIEALRGCVRKLDERDQRFVQMRYDKKFPSKKIADLFGISIHSFYRAMARIYKLLEVCIGRSLAEEAAGR